MNAALPHQGNYLERRTSATIDGKKVMRENRYRENVICMSRTAMYEAKNGGSWCFFNLFHARQSTRRANNFNDVCCGIYTKRVAAPSRRFGWPEPFSVKWSDIPFWRRPFLFTARVLWEWCTGFTCSYPSLGEATAFYFA